jgi:hypothetical protein
MDESESSADFDGWVPTITTTWQQDAPWMGSGPSWQCAEVLENARGDGWEYQAAFDFVYPFIKRSYDDMLVTVDGDLNEWHDFFPYRFNSFSVPDSTRSRFWPPDDNEDMSGTLMAMYDDDYFYFAAHVVDDAPGHFSDASWAADAIEFYSTNWDIEDAYWPDKVSSWLNDPATGQLDIQLNISFDESLDTLVINEYYAVGGQIISDNTEAVYQIWPDGDGYNIEGKIFLEDITSPSTGLTFSFTEGTRQGATYNIYDMDESESSADFDGWVYTAIVAGGKQNAPWMGSGDSWQYWDVKSISMFEYLDWLSKNSTGVDDGNGSVPRAFALDNYPNPFNPATNLRFTLDKVGQVTLHIYDLGGRLVKTVYDNVAFTAGAHQVNVDMANLASGVYVSVLQQGDRTITHKMMLMK